MSRALKERKSDQDLSSARKKQPTPASSEHLMELRSRLRIEEANARWQRQKEMLLVGAAVIVVLSACVASTYFILSNSAPSDRVLAFYVLGQMISLLVGVVMGKNLNWKK